MPAAKTPATLVVPTRSTATKPRSSTSQPSCPTEPAPARSHVWMHEESCSVDQSTVGEHHASQAISLDDEPPNLAVDNADAARVELVALGLGQVVRVREEDQVVRPLPDESRVLDGAAACAENSERLIADFPAVAVGAVQEVAPPAVLEPGSFAVSRRRSRRRGAEPGRARARRSALRRRRRRRRRHRSMCPCRRRCRRRDVGATFVGVSTQ